VDAPPRPDEAEHRARGQLKPELLETKASIHAQLVELSAGGVDLSNRDAVRARIVELTEAHVRATRLPLTRADFDMLVESLLDDVLGLGPLEPLLADPDITEIMIN